MWDYGRSITLADGSRIAFMRKLRCVPVRQAVSCHFGWLLIPRRPDESDSWFTILPMVYRSDNRTPEQMRPVNIFPDFISTAEGSALI